MPPLRSSKRDRIRLCAAVVVVMAACLAFDQRHASASSAAAGAGADFALDDDPPRWPAFSDALDDSPAPQAGELTPPGWIPRNEITAVGSAPLPPSVVAGLLMLGGNWVMTRMWKKRRI